MEPFHWWAVIFGFSSAEYKWKDELWWDAFQTNFTFSVRWDQQMTTEPRKKVCLFLPVPVDSGVNKPLIGCKQQRIHLPPGKMSLCSDIISHRGGWAGCQWSKHICLQHKRLHKRLCVCVTVCVLVALCSSQAGELYGYKKGIWGECLFGTQPLNECCLRTNWSQHSAAPLLSREPRFPPSDCPIINLRGRLLRLSAMLWF